MKQKYADKLQWLKMGIPYLDNPDSNPNAHVFTLAMPWEDVEKIIIKLKARLDVMFRFGFICGYETGHNDTVDGCYTDSAEAAIDSLKMAKDDGSFQAALKQEQG